MYFDVLTSDEQEVQDVSFVRDEMVRLQWVNLNNFVEESGRTNVVIVAYTTAQARLQLYQYLENWVKGRYIVIQTLYFSHQDKVNRYQQPEIT